MDMKVWVMLLDILEECGLSHVMLKHMLGVTFSRRMQWDKILKGESLLLYDDALVARVHELLHRDCEVQILHINHVRNVVADGLTLLARGRDAS
ncbi:hypothetical protein V6N11_052670 [Hibiscus sabdariffa]|uniref:RNase H type-1 domain-containing protein n=1 Tax=Hibiscus sabdariffa TaxID=183260 RepID=A0ABR2UB78_9ROSI